MLISSDDGLIVSVTVPDVVRLYDWDKRLITLIPQSIAEKQEELIIHQLRYPIHKNYESAKEIPGDTEECFYQLEIRTLRTQQPSLIA